MCKREDGQKQERRNETTFMDLIRSNKKGLRHGQFCSFRCFVALLFCLISLTIWCLNVKITNNGTMWPKLWPQSKYESPRWGTSNEYPQHMFLWRTGENYPIIITKYSSLTIPMSQILIRLEALWIQLMAVWSFFIITFHHLNDLNNVERDIKH